MINVRQVGLPILAGFYIMTAVGCGSDPKTASNENFAKAIGHIYEDPKRSALCTYIYYDRRIGLPAQSLMFPRYPYDGLKTESNNALVSAGLLRRTGAAKVMLHSGAWEMVEVYDRLSDSEARDRGISYDTVGMVFGNDDNSQRITACVGRIAFDKVVNFTAPADAFGQHVTNVSYTARFTDQQPWAKDGRLLSTFPAIRTLIEGEAKLKTVTLVLTNNGWEEPS